MSSLKHLSICMRGYIFAQNRIFLPFPAPILQNWYFTPKYSDNIPFFHLFRLKYPFFLINHHIFFPSQPILYIEKYHVQIEIKVIIYFESQMISRSMVIKAILRKVSCPATPFLVPRIVSRIEPGAVKVFSKSIIFLN